MSTDADKHLMECALRQLDGKINYDVLARDRGGDVSKVAAQWRWIRLKKKLQKDSPNTPPGNKTPKASSPKKVKTPNGRSKASAAKKRRISSSDDEEDYEIALDVKDERIADGDHTIDPRSVYTAPSRSLPTRKARVTSFKQESSEEPDEEEFADSGHGSTPAEEDGDDDA